MNGFVGNLLLAAAWAFAQGDFSTFQFAVGFVLGYAVLWLGGNIVGATRYCRNLPLLFELLLFFCWELLQANFRVAKDVVALRHRFRPGIIAMPLEAKTDTEIMLLANLISLTPGTLSLGVSNDRRVLYVHALDIDDPEKQKQTLKDGFERRLLKVLR